MAGVVTRKPVVGIAAGALFGALGGLLLGIEGSDGLARVLFSVAGGFFLFVGIISIVTALIVISRSRRS
jgi:zinc transporter ZupT